MLAPDALNVTEVFSQTFWSGPALTAGKGFIVTVVVPVEVQPKEVVVNEYTPPLTIDELGMVGVCKFEENPFGPVQLYESAIEPFNCMVEPSQYGPVLLAEATPVPTV
jgi:hypothetical protein